jgi:hypothetical protein
VTVNFPLASKELPPVLLADENGAIHLFWISSDGGLFYGQATSTNLSNPNSWNTTSRLARDVIGFDVTLDAVGALHIAYVVNSSTDASPAGIYYRQSIIGGGFWSEVSKLYESEYFRVAKQDDVYIRISTSNSIRNQKIIVTWDNRAQKRVFMAISEDSGATWGASQQIKGPEDTGGIDTPFNLTVSAFEENALLIWQAGEPGSSRCTVYSQWSEDGGINWSDATTVLGGRSECPLSTKIISKDTKYISVMFIGQVSPVLVAWNGYQWSDVQTQIQLPSFSNPLTYDAILLGCRYDIIYNDRLYVAGCDQGRGKDVWFLSRMLEPMENWFMSSEIFGEPVVLTARSEDPERISNFYSTADNSGNIHAVWVQSKIGQEAVSDLTIKYARWDGSNWTTPESIIAPLNGIPLQLSITTDSFGRLLLTWIDGFNGDLVFSWANLEQANLSSGWVELTGLPVPSRLVDSSDLVVDGSGRIFAVYGIPINESRGIYIVQSTDSGKNWSAPIRVFDAVAESWERVENPRISLGSDGVLQLIFVRHTVRFGQPEGLYYSRSADGGRTWSDPQILSEGEIQWADITSYGDKTVHIIWQEYDGLVYANVSQISLDGGLTWGKQNDIAGVNESPTKVSIASDGHGVLHFIQLVSKDSLSANNQKGFILQDWKWDGVNWMPDLVKDFVIKGEEVTYDLSTYITSTGFLGVFIPVEFNNSSNSVQSEVLTFSRFLEDAGDNSHLPIPIAPESIDSTEVSGVSVSQPTPTQDFSMLLDNNDSSSPIQKNVTGLVLIGAGVIATLILLLWRRPSNRIK